MHARNIVQIMETPDNRKMSSLMNRTRLSFNETELDEYYFANGLIRSKISSRWWSGDKVVSWFISPNDKEKSGTDFLDFFFRLLYFLLSKCRARSWTELRENIPNEQLYWQEPLRKQ